MMHSGKKTQEAIFVGVVSSHRSFENEWSTQTTVISIGASNLPEWVEDPGFMPNLRRHELLDFS
jgi:hypothetical protein